MSKYQYSFLWGSLIVVTLSTWFASGSGLTGAADKEKISVCHILSDPHTTLDVPEQAVDAHVKHGDYLGPCVDDSSSSSSEASSESSSSSSLSESSSSSSSSETSNESSPPADTTTEHQASPSTISGSSGGGGGGGGAEVLQPIFRGHGLAEHASAADFILSTYDLQPNSQYSFGNEGQNPQVVLSASTTDIALREHAAACSMFRYFQQLQVVRPTTPDDYIDWLSARIATALDKDPGQMKNALLGRPTTGADSMLNGISDQGCAANSYVYVPAEGGTAPAIEKPELHPVHTDQTNPLQHDEPTDDLRVLDESTDTELAFSMLHGNDVFEDYGNSLTHEMHLIIIRDDLQYFYHIHPERDQLGVWHIPFAPAVAGTYWIYANFTDADGHSYGLRFTRAYPGGGDMPAEILNLSERKIVDSYHFVLEPAITETGMSFAYNITDDAGTPVRVEEFMGAFGHQVILSTNGYFNHSHPAKRVGEDPVFYVDTPPPGTYMIVAAFQIHGKDFTLAFRWAH